MTRRCIAPCLAALLALVAACSAPTEVRRHPRVEDDPALRDARINEDIEVLRAHVETYFHRYGEPPRHLPQLRDTPDGVALIESVPLDPWSVPYLLRRLDLDVLIFSTGEDLLIGTADDQGIRMSFDGVVADHPVPAAADDDDATRRDDFGDDDYDDDGDDYDDRDYE